MRFDRKLPVFCVIVFTTELIVCILKAIMSAALLINTHGLISGQFDFDSLDILDQVAVMDLIFSLTACVMGITGCIMVLRRYTGSLKFLLTDIFFGALSLGAMILNLIYSVQSEYRNHEETMTFIKKVVPPMTCRFILWIFMIAATYKMFTFFQNFKRERMSQINNPYS